ncbi:hypothetical protein [Salinibaculum salinum]|uniref:hypothetical protein n=1 Tax=Salinibaculum salinum TaxID=3131996 RepID=UPI0030EED8C5
MSNDDGLTAMERYLRDNDDVSLSEEQEEQVIESGRDPDNTRPDSDSDSDEDTEPPETGPGGIPVGSEVGNQGTPSDEQTTTDSDDEETQTPDTRPDVGLSAGPLDTSQDTDSSDNSSTDSDSGSDDSGGLDTPASDVTEGNFGVQPETPQGTPPDPDSGPSPDTDSPGPGQPDFDTPENVPDEIGEPQTPEPDTSTSDTSGTESDDSGTDSPPLAPETGPAGIPRGEEVGTPTAETDTTTEDTTQDNRPGGLRVDREPLQEPLDPNADATFREQAADQFDRAYQGVNISRTDVSVSSGGVELSRSGRQKIEEAQRQEAASDFSNDLDRDVAASDIVHEPCLATGGVRAFE